MPLDPDFLAQLVCPLCKTGLVARGEDRLDCVACGRTYPVRDGIPLLLVEEALPEEPPRRRTDDEDRP